MKSRWVRSLRRFLPGRTLVRTILSHLLSGVLLTAILSLAVSNVILSRIEAKAVETARISLQQTYQSIRIILEDIYGDFYTLQTGDATIIQAMRPDGAPVSAHPEIGRLLSGVALKDEAVHSVYLINQDTDLVFSDHAGPVSIAQTDDPGAVALLDFFSQNYDEYKDDVFFSRTLSQKAVNGAARSPVPVLSAIFTGPSSELPFRSGLIVNIDTQLLSSLVQTNQTEGMLLMVNPTGRLIASLSEATPSADLSNDAAVRSILADPGDEGSFTADFLGDKTRLIYRKANALGFVLIRALPYRTLRKEAEATNRIVTVLFLVAILISLAAGILSARRIYRPLSQLVEQTHSLIRTTGSTESDPSMKDEYEFLQTAYAAMAARNRQSGLFRLILGQFNDEGLSELDLHHPVFVTFALLPDHPATFNAQAAAQLLEMASAHKDWHLVVMGSDSISGVINAETFGEDDCDRLVDQITRLQAQFQIRTGQTVSVGIGSIVEGPACVRTSHRYALAAAQQALAAGENQLYIHDELEQSRKSPVQSRSAVVSRIETFVREHMHEPDLTTERIAEEAGFSAGYIRQLFRQERGITLNDYLTSSRIELAKFLLETTDLPARRIAESVGYADSRYFYTLFKKKTGETTDEYRQRIGQNGAERV